MAKTLIFDQSRGQTEEIIVTNSQENPEIFFLNFRASDVLRLHSIMVMVAFELVTFGSGVLRLSHLSIPKDLGLGSKEA